MSLILTDIWQHLQRWLFPTLVTELGDLTDKDQEFVKILAILPKGSLLDPYQWKGIGRKPEQREWILNGFVAKAVYGLTTTRALLDALRARPVLRRLCGWESLNDIPNEWTFSRAFAEFAQGQLPQQIHEAMIQIHRKHRLVGHVSRDSTAIEAREKPVEKPAPTPKEPRKRGRPPRGQEPPPPPPKRLELQPQRSLEENLKDLPQNCDVGCKRNSNGHQECWIGFKLHMDIIDGDLPVSAILTSASVHDSQVAIPLAQTTANRITWLYDLMDSAYDAPQIRDYSKQHGHVAIIDPNPRRGEVIGLDPAEAERFKERSAAERVNSQLKDNYGGRFVRVRGAAKVMAHLMYGIVALTAAQLYRIEL